MAKYPANLSSLDPLLAFVRNAVLNKEWPKNEVTLFEVAVEEAVVNIIQHGYKDSEGEIELNFLDTPKSLARLEIKDTGLPFDPLALKGNFNPELSLEDRDIGGNGILLMKKILDNFIYKREPPFNILVLEKSAKRS